MPWLLQAHAAGLRAHVALPTAPGLVLAAVAVTDGWHFQGRQKGRDIFKRSRLLGNKEWLVLCIPGPSRPLNSTRPLVRGADPVSVSFQDGICCSVPWLPVLLSLPG